MRAFNRKKGLRKTGCGERVFMFLQQHTLKRQRIMITACVFCLLHLLISGLPASLFTRLFCEVPAWLATLYLGATCEGTTLALRSGHSLVVTRACGGSDFFILVVSMIVWYALAPEGLGFRAGATCFSQRHRVHRGEWPYCLIALLPYFFIAWVFVNVVNSMRVVLSAWTRIISEALLPERFDGAVHLVSGVMIFFPALLCVWWFCKTKQMNRGVA
jgi:hypothetical protein